MLRLEHVSKTYKKKKVLDDITLSIERGQSIGVIGPNGAGKSTFLRILSSMERTDEGSLYFEGIPYRQSVQSLRQQIGYIPQEVALYEELTVHEQIKFWGKLTKIKPSASFQDQMITMLGLEDVMNERVDRLSGGWRRKMNLCIGMLHNPSICLLDEPTAGIDLAAKEDILSWLNYLHHQGTTILCISHDWLELERLSEDYLIFNDGKLLLEGNQEKLRTFKQQLKSDDPKDKELQKILKYS